MTLCSLRYRLPLSFALLFFTSTTIAAWQRFEANADLLITLFGEDALVSDHDGRPGFIDGQGIERFPGCSEGPQPIIDEAGQLVGPLPPPTSPGEFSFFVETGADEEFATDLLIYLAGGGVCWDSATCIGSALTPIPSYYTAVFETEGSLDAASADAIPNT